VGRSSCGGKGSIPDGTSAESLKGRLPVKRNKCNVRSEEQRAKKRRNVTGVTGLKTGEVVRVPGGERGLSRRKRMRGNPYSTYRPP